MNGQ
jgi:hypothetical protein